MALALVDCESFYASCERIFRPDLKHVPIVVLSNNDGCVIQEVLKQKRWVLVWESRGLKSKILFSPKAEKFSRQTLLSMAICQLEL